MKLIPSEPYKTHPTCFCCRRASLDRESIEPSFHPLKHGWNSSLQNPTKPNLQKESWALNQRKTARMKSLEGLVWWWQLWRAGGDEASAMKEWIRPSPLGSTHRHRHRHRDRNDGDGREAAGGAGAQRLCHQEHVRGRHLQGLCMLSSPPLPMWRSIHC